MRQQSSERRRRTPETVAVPIRLAICDPRNLLHEKGAVDVEKLRDYPTFVDTVIQATRIAATTSNRAKLDALRAAVTNAATWESPDETRRQMFLRLVDDFTGWHLRFVALYDDPHRWCAENGDEPRRAGMRGTTEIAGVLNAAFPEMHSEGELRERIWKDLFAAGLVGAESLRSVSSEAGRYASRTTQLGKDFMKFIRLPTE